MRPVPALALAALLAAAAPAAGQSAGQTAADPGAPLRAYLDALAPHGFSGVALVERNDTVLLHHAAGLADDRAGTPMTDSTPLLVGSVAKQVTAAAILGLEADGALALDDTVGAFLDAPAPLSGVTLHELLTHTAGLPYHPPEGFDVPAERVTESLLRAPVDPAKRGAHAYSNVGYGILAAVVDAAAGEPFEAYARRRLLEPAGMARTWFMTERAAHPAGDAVRSYAGGEDEGTLNAFPALPAARGAGTVVSTVGDLHRWVEALEEGRVLPAEAWVRMTAPQVAVQPGLAYGYGWNVATTVRGTTVLAHGGDLGGYNTELRRYPDEGLTLVVASNRRPWGTGYRMAVANALSLLLAGADVPAPPPARPVTEAEARALAGAWTLESGGRLEVEAAGGAVVLAVEDADAAAVLHGGALPQGAPAPARRRFVAAAAPEGGLVAFDPATGRTVRVEVVGAGGRPSELVIAGDAGRFRARRAGTGAALP